MGRDVRNDFILEKVSSHSLVHSNISLFFMEVKKRKMDRVVRWPSSCWNCLTLEGFTIRWQVETYIDFLQCLFLLTWSQWTFPLAPWSRTWWGLGACYTSWLTKGRPPSMQHGYALYWYLLSCHQHRPVYSTIYGGRIRHPSVTSRWHQHFSGWRAWDYSSSCHGLTWMLYLAYRWVHYNMVVPQKGLHKAQCIISQGSIN